VRILLLSPNQIARYNWGHQLFRNEIGKEHEVVYYGEGYKGWDPNLSVSQIIRKFYVSSPDVLLTYGWRYSRPFQGFDRVNIPRVHIAVDYVGKKGSFKGTILPQGEFFERLKPAIVFGVTSLVVENLKQNNICDKIFLLPFSVDTNIYKQIPDTTKVIDVLAAFTVRDDVYPNRSKVHRMLKGMKGLRTLTKSVSQMKFIKAISASKITITSNNIYNSLSMRYTEVLSCGGFLLADKPEDFDRFGYIDGKHLVLYKDINDLRDKIQYYLKHDSEREHIARQGMKFVRKYHSCKRRVGEFIDIVKHNINGL